MKMTTAELVYRGIVKHPGSTPQDIADRLRIARHTVYPVLLMLLDRGIVSRERCGHWHYTAVKSSDGALRAEVKTHYCDVLDVITANPGVTAVGLADLMLWSLQRTKLVIHDLRQLNLIVGVITDDGQAGYVVTSVSDENNIAFRDAAHQRRSALRDQAEAKARELENKKFWRRAADMWLIAMTHTHDEKQQYQIKCRRDRCIGSCQYQPPAGYF